MTHDLFVNIQVLVEHSNNYIKQKKMKIKDSVSELKYTGINLVS